MNSDHWEREGFNRRFEQACEWQDLDKQVLSMSDKIKRVSRHGMIAR